MHCCPVYNILLIGKELFTLKRQLEKREHKVFYIEKGYNALKHISNGINRKYEVIIIDTNINNVGIWEILRVIKSRDPMGKTVTIVLSDFNDENTEIQSLNLGADDYIAKPFSLMLILARIESSLKKKSSNKFIDTCLPNHKSPETALTKREIEILRYIINGDSNKEIADKCFISTMTVSNHIKNIFRKLNVGTRTQAVLYALKYKIVEE